MLLEWRNDFSPKSQLSSCTDLAKLTVPMFYLGSHLTFCPDWALTPASTLQLGLISGPAGLSEHMVQIIEMVHWCVVVSSAFGRDDKALVMMVDLDRKSVV